MAKPPREPERPSNRDANSRDGNRIAKLLARAGIASRREIERMIGESRIALNGVVIDTPATVLQSLNGVTVDGEPVAAAAPARLFLFHKPTGVLTAASDPGGRQTIYDRLPPDLPRLMPVGRLDLNTEGLLLLTTDGELKRLLELPSTGVERSYRARAYGQVTQEQLESLIEGIEIDGIRYGSIDANLERRTGANVWIEMTLTEGKNREVRRVLEHLGLRVSRLIRTRYGPFILSDMPVASVGEVRQVDLITFRKTLKTSAGKQVAIAVSTGEAPRQPRRAPAKPRPPAPRKAEVKEALETRAPRAVMPRPTGRPPRPAVDKVTPASRVSPQVASRDSRTRGDEDSARRGPRPEKPPQRKVGWARPKPKSGPGKPKVPRK